MAVALEAAAQAEDGNMKRVVILKVFAFFLGCHLSLQAQDDTARLKLVFAGDIMGHDSQIAASRTADGYSYDTCFSVLEPYIKDADIAIANLEVTLAGPPFKGYPQFSSPDDLAVAARNSGFDLLLTANNHSLDRRKSGMERTIDVLDTLNIIRTGTFKDDEQRKKEYPLIIEKNNIRLAILNYTYGTNGIPSQEPNVVNLIDREQIKADLEKARTAEPDYTLVTIHWGLEYQREESEQQRELARFIAENGADAIIGSHPHVVQPVKEIESGEKSTLVVYSLGNFISNQRKRYTDGGILFEMTLEKTDTTMLADYGYLPVWVYKAPANNGGKHFVLLPSNKDADYYRSTFGISDTDLQKLKLFNDDTTEHLEYLEQRKGL